MKFVFFVEGYTEHEAVAGFLKRWLDPQLKQPVGIQTVRFSGWQHLVSETPIKARMHLDDPRNGPKVIAVIALLDLYGPTFYPPRCQSAAERYDWARHHLEQQVNDQRFRQFFAVHETEAWLLSQPDLFPADIRRALPGKIVHPEQVNNDEPPAKLLNRIYRAKTGRDYKKVTDGKDLFQRLDPHLAAQRCPRLKALLDTLLQLARERGL